ncbi:MAG TPA: hypothetical protein VNO18_25025 [Xanthobacteraceae bacterium]|jgi:hypothetical protein|nr:hypothetical protein [Xanthobacteraceae bacterium]
MQRRTRQHAQTGEPAGGAHDPLHYTRKMSAQLSEMIDHLRRDIDQVDEPQFKAMFETAAEVLGGLVTAFRHYEQKGEHAWKPTRNS